MSSSDSYNIQLLTNIPIYLNQYVATILYAIGNIGNLFTMIIFFKKSWRKNVCVFYFLVCLFSNTMFINLSLLGTIFIVGFDINFQNSSVVLCKLFYYISYFTSSYYPIVLILASIDRLLISSQNVDTRLYSSKRLAYFSVSLSLFVCSVFALHLLIKVDIQEIFPTVFICYYDLSPFYLNFFTYSTLVLSSAIPFALMILSILAFKNVRVIRSVPRQQRRQIRTMNKKDFQLLRCLYIHNIVYIIGSTLVVISICYTTIFNGQTLTLMGQAVSSFLGNFGAFLHYIPYSTSFIIFVCVSKAFRLELKRLVYKICRKDLTTIREEEPPRDIIELGNVVSTIDLNA